MIRMRDIVGVFLSAGFTGLIFLWPLPVGLLGLLLPSEFVTVEPDRTATFLDGAMEISQEEVDGILEGTLMRAPVEPPDTPEPPTPQPPPEPEGTEDGEQGDGQTEVAKAAPSQLGDPKRPAASSGGGGKKGPKGAPPQPVTGEVKKRSRRKCPDSYEGVVRRDDGIIAVKRDLVESYTGNMARFNELGWSRSNDKGPGWVIGGFGCFGPLWHGGMRRGDVVLTVNGKKTNNLVQVMGLYAKFRNKSYFQVQLLRRGRRRTLRYELVD